MTPRHGSVSRATTTPSYDRHIAAITGLYHQNKDLTTVTVKQELWETLLGVALGEIDGVDIDDLFVRHTYLTTVVGMITQAVFGLDIAEHAVTDPADLVHGIKFSETTGLADVVESDFFSWIVEVDGFADTIRSIANHVGAYDWGPGAPAQLSSYLYQTVIPADERKQLGEYYTPDWLASEIVATAVTNPLNQRVLDPACGSGAFLTAAVRHLIAAAETAGLDATTTLTKLQQQVTGIDVHPVAVHLARSAWVMSARDVINEGNTGTMSVPVHLGDSLQLLYDSESMFTSQEIPVPVPGPGPGNRELRFPRSLVDRADTFGAAMSAIAEAVHEGRDPHMALTHHDLDDSERALMDGTVNTMRDLHTEGRNHIWAYYTRNLVRPIAIANSKVDVLIGNPPFLAYNKAINTLRKKLRDLSEAHQIWAGGRYATHQDIAGLFFLRSMDLYLKDDDEDSNGVCSMVLPHSALNAGQYEKWRTGKWSSATRTLNVNMAWQTPWDLEPLTPNDFFPVPACVVHAQRRSTATSLPPQVQRWEGTPTNHKREEVTRLTLGTPSPYEPIARQGATIVPRCLFFVDESPPPTSVFPPDTLHTNPRRGVQDKEPWKDLPLRELKNNTVEAGNVFDVHLGETIAPYTTLNPLRAVLPIADASRADTPSHLDGSEQHGAIRRILSSGSLPARTSKRWNTMSDTWEQHKSQNNKLTLLGQLDYLGKLTTQLEWQANHNSRPHRVVYSSSGRATAAVLENSDALIDCTLFWIACRNIDEAHYLAAVINSDTLRDAVDPLMPKGQFGARHLQKHLWKLDIGEYDHANRIHIRLSQLGRAAADEAAVALADLRTQLTKKDRILTIRAARKALRYNLAASATGQKIETLVKKLGI